MEKAREEQRYTEHFVLESYAGDDQPPDEPSDWEIDW